MYELKTKPTDIAPDQVIAAISDEGKRADAGKLLAIFEEATGKPPVVWGEKLIGFDLYRYTRGTGRQYEIYATGFAVTKKRITLHMYLEGPAMQEYVRRLGKATAGKSCVYINKLADIDMEVLREMVQTAISYTRRI